MIFFKIRTFTQFVIDLTISVLFVLSSMFLLRFMLPAGGPTATFLDRSYKLVGFVFIVLCIIFIFFLIRDNNFKFKKKFDFPQFKDFILISLPMSPIIGYSIINVEYLDILGLLYLIGYTFIFSFVLTFILPSIFSYFGSFKMLMISGLALSFTILTMPSILSNPNNHLFNSQFLTQASYLIFSFIIMYMLYIFNQKIAYIVAIVFMLTGSAENLFYKFSEKDFTKVQSTNRLEIFTDNDKNKIIDTRNIYIIAYESYANLETLKYYGYDNKKQIEYLENNNFTIYHGVYSNGASSISSISRLFDINGKLYNHGRYYTSGNAFGLNIFKANEYKTVGIFSSPYYFGAYPITWDEYYPKANVSQMGGKTITKAIYEGEFRFDIFGDDFGYDKYLEVKNQYLSSSPKEPTLLYTHNKLPGHSNNSGKCLPNEKQIYFENLKKANIEMKTDVSTLKINDPNAIIVLLGDHGPYLTKNCSVLRDFKMDLIDRYDVQDRYGAFLAVHWPNKITQSDNNIEIIQDIFPSILATISNNKQLIDELKVERKFFDRYKTRISGVNILDGIIIGGKDDGKLLFEKRSY